MKRYGDWRPTGCDPSGLGLPDQQDWVVGPCSQNRDSGTLDRSNFRVLVRELEAAGAEYEVHRFGHWACGWFEIVLVPPGSKGAELCEESEAALSDYPILDDSDHSDLECEEIYEYWARASLRERVELCSRHGAHIMAARRDEVPDRVWDHLRDELT